jgi:hypothetical protein
VIVFSRMTRSSKIGDSGCNERPHCGQTCIPERWEAPQKGMWAAVARRKRGAYGFLRNAQSATVGVAATLCVLSLYRVWRVSGAGYPTTPRCERTTGQCLMRSGFCLTPSKRCAILQVLWCL